MKTLENNILKFAELSARTPKYLQEKEFAFGDLSLKLQYENYIEDVAEDLRYIETRLIELNY
jgi:hypothetical protein